VPASICSKTAASVDGRKIELILRDDAGIADNSRRIAQELLVGGKSKLCPQWR
jgi:branched-chain amino acid transport system substrate-binding protein